MSSRTPELVQSAVSWTGRSNWTIGRSGLSLKKHLNDILWQSGEISNLIKQLDDRRGCLTLTSVRVKDAPHSVPTLYSPIQGWFSSASGWHCMLCSIWHRWDLSCWVYRSISIYPIKCKDHSRILGSCGFLSSYCVVLWGRISCFGLQESGWGSAVRQWDTLVQTEGPTVYHCYTTVKVYLNKHQPLCYISVSWII